ncbi:MAG: helix-turn-helix transcriptional regulator [Clostridiales bacterium]|jgi:DNA-binding XRE family transcriptional regulator|nr:helix-turn-helix transcriptional regulator [Clostridiales bacterium]
MLLRLKRERLLKGDWTQAYVAEQLGLTRQAFNQIETGKRKPSYEVMIKLENLFGMSHRELFSLVDDKPDSA